MVKYVNPLALATKQHKADNKFEEALGLLSKPLEAAANAIVPAQLTVAAKLKAADKAVVGSSLNSKVSSGSSYSSSREDYSADYSSSSRGAAEVGVEKPYSVAAIANKDSLVNNNFENNTDQLVNNSFENGTDQLENNNFENNTDQLENNNFESLTDQLLDISSASK
jgi:hypothetical protein